ncbi:MAG: hypothetical protein BWY82_00591 [Verrucomicrobia bacterium ADurb.Bin474]|nr:MAG: hypothetical protein BWY82_00591 [Verrucomicrobia bacterium ADurb.Bin474]
MLVYLVASGAHRFLKQVDGLGVEEVVFTIAAPLIDAARIKCAFVGFDMLTSREGSAVANECLLGDFVDSRTLAAAGSAREECVHKLGAQPDGLEDLGTAIRCHCGDPHLCHRLYHALDGCLDIVVDRLLEIHVEHGILDHLVDGIERHVWIDGIHTVADEQREVVHFAGLAGFHDDRGAGARALRDQVLVKSAYGQQGRDRGIRGVYTAVGQDEDVDAQVDGVIRFGVDAFYGRIEAGSTFGSREGCIDGGGFEAIQRDLLELGQSLVVDDRVIEPDHAAAARVRLQEVPFRSDEGLGGGHQLFADAVESRVGDLREDLLEILIQVLGLVG